MRAETTEIDKQIAELKSSKYLELYDLITVTSNQTFLVRGAVLYFRKI